MEPKMSMHGDENTAEAETGMTESSEERRNSLHS